MEECRIRLYQAGLEGEKLRLVLGFLRELLPEVFVERRPDVREVRSGDPAGSSPDQLARAGQDVGFLKLRVPQRRAGLERLVVIDAQPVDDGVRKLLGIARGRRNRMRSSTLTASGPTQHFREPPGGAKGRTVDQGRADIEENDHRTFSLSRGRPSSRIPCAPLRGPGTARARSRYRHVARELPLDFFGALAAVFADFIPL